MVMIFKLEYRLSTCIQSNVRERDKKSERTRERERERERERGREKGILSFYFWWASFSHLFYKHFIDFTTL